MEVTSGRWSVLSLLAAMACGGPVQSTAVESAPQPAGKPAARDLSIDVTEPVSVRARPPRPAALSWPKAPAVPERGPSLAVLRRRVDRRRRPRERDVRRLAGMLIAKAEAVEAGDGGPEEVETLLSDARKVLRKLAKAKTKSKLEAATLELQAYAEARTGKTEQALEILTELRKRGETSTFALATEVTARLVDDDASAPDELLAAVLPADAGPSLPYARAWLRLKKGDVSNAYLDLSKAVAAWDGKVPRKVRKELTMLAAIAGVDADDLAKALSMEEEGRDRMLTRLARAYGRLGKYHQAAELETGRDLEGAAGAEQLRRRSDLAYQMAEPEPAATHLIRATELATSCGEPCQELSAELSKRALDMARFFHTVYATTQDPRYFEPARMLYNRLQATTGDAEVDQLVRDLVRHKVGADPSAGVHTKEVLAPFVEARARAIRSCYALELIRKPSLGGLLQLRWSIDSTGEVTGAASQPPAGEEGLAAVAKCALEHSRRWRFPGRFVRGETRLTMRFELTRDVEQR